METPDSAGIQGPWIPQEEGLRQILQLLKESQSSDNSVQKIVNQVQHSWFDLMIYDPFSVTHLESGVLLLLLLRMLT